MDAPDVVEETIQALEAIPEAGPLADARSFDESSSGALDFQSDGAEVSIEAGAEPTIQLTSDDYDAITVEAALPGSVALAEGGTAVFSAGEDYSVAPLPHADGSVQIVTVIESNEAPDRYDYQLSGPSVNTLQIVDNGMVFLLDAEGKFAGGVSAPWAFDANGVAVPTHFEVHGTTLTQVVDHKSGSFAYPISADPWLGINLWGLIWTDTYSGQTRINLNLSQWGKDNWTTPPLILLGAGWDEALNRSPGIRSALTSKETIHQQFDCHAFGAPFAGTWNLEKFRPTRTVDWSFGVAIHHCNWTTATQY